MGQPSPSHHRPSHPLASRIIRRAAVLLDFDVISQNAERPGCHYEAFTWRRLPNLFGRRSRLPAPNNGRLVKASRVAAEVNSE